jgi:glycosyltransferase involved in cell wall biosynthesis
MGRSEQPAGEALNNVPIDEAPMPPLLTIGLPVYNGADYLRETMESVRDQTFTDYEFIVCDNDSTDETPEIVAEFAESDGRIKYVKHPENIGAHNNYNSIVPLARGKYFKWVAHDDLMEPGFIEACVSVLDNRPDVVLAFTAVDKIDTEGAKIGELVSTRTYEHDSPYTRLRAYIGDRVKAPPIFGVMRTQVLRETRLLGNFGGADTIFLAEMSMRGRFAVIDEHLFKFRFHDTRYSAKDAAEIRKWFDPSRNAPILSSWRKLGTLLGAVWRVPMPLTARLRCTLFVGYWGLRHSNELGGDVLSRFRYEVGRVGAALKRS